MTSGPVPLAGAATSSIPSEKWSRPLTFPIPHGASSAAMDSPSRSAWAATRSWTASHCSSVVATSRPAWWQTSSAAWDCARWTPVLVTSSTRQRQSRVCGDGGPTGIGSSATRAASPARAAHGPAQIQPLPQQHATHNVNVALAAASCFRRHPDRAESAICSVRLPDGPAEPITLRRKTGPACGSNSWLPVTNQRRPFDDRSAGNRPGLSPQHRSIDVSPAEDGAVALDYVTRARRVTPWPAPR
jgi:hypothetical protein